MSGNFQGTIRSSASCAFSIPIASQSQLLLSQCVQTSVEAVLIQLRCAEIINTNESGLRVRRKLHWLAKVSDKRRTHYEIHTKKGFETMDAIGL